jgi:TorA maturation chaperone TorD
VSILVVSSNPLFKEIIIEAVVHSQTEILELLPEKALELMCDLKPDVIIIDETITKPVFELLLANSRRLQKSRTIVLNPAQNEILLLDSRRTKIRKTDDLLKEISIYQDETLSNSDDGKLEMAIETAKNLANLIHFLTSLFIKPPNVDLVSMLRILRFNEISGYEMLVGTNGEIETGFELIQGFLENSAGLSEDQTARLLYEDWSGLFDPENPSGLKKPYESLYSQDGSFSEELPQHLISEYSCGGLLVDENIRRQVDSIAVELNFIGSLSYQAAVGLEIGNLDLVRALRGQAISFYQDHLGLWASTYLSEALKHAQTDLFKGVIHLTSGVVVQLGDLLSFQHSS